MSDTYYIGVDPGLSSCGWAVLSASDTDTQPKYAASGIWKSENGTPWERSPVMFNQMRESFKKWREKYGSKIFMAVETPSFGSSYNSQNVSFCRGLMASHAVMFGMSVVDVPPSSWKKAVTGDGRSKKKESARVLANKIGLPYVADFVADEADALGVAYWLWMSTSKTKPSVTKPEETKHNNTLWNQL